MLIDANVLVYSLDQLAIYHAACLRFLEAALSRAIAAVLVPQVLLECFSVVTSRKYGRRTISPRDILAEIEFWRGAIPILQVKTEALDELSRLVAASPRTGPGVYDLFLVAQMRTHGIREICTLNVRDFRLPGIRALTPEAVMRRLGA
jgi:predicted nucleic acid-binding protein